MKIRTFWDVAPSSALIIETVYFNETTWSNISEDCHLHTRCHVNLKSHMNGKCYSFLIATAWQSVVCREAKSCTDDPMKRSR
jgi:hypothetical protein